jgi:hypothetical protein
MIKNGLVTRLADTLKAKDGVDRFSPEHVAQLVLYLASPLCRFTGCLCSAKGVGVFLWRERNVAYHVNNGAKTWTTDPLAAALDAFPQQDECWNLLLGGRVTGLSPADYVLESVGALSKH